MKSLQLEDRLETILKKLEANPERGRRMLKRAAGLIKTSSEELLSYSGKDHYKPSVGLAQSLLHARGVQVSAFTGSYAGAFVEFEGDLLDTEISFYGHCAGLGARFSGFCAGQEAEFFGYRAGSSVEFIGDYAGAGAKFHVRDSGQNTLFEGDYAGLEASFKGKSSGHEAKFKGYRAGERVTKSE